MNLQKLREIAAARTEGIWSVEHRNVYFKDGKSSTTEHLLAYKDDPNYDFLGAEVVGPLIPGRGSFTSIDAEFIATVANTFDVLLEIAEAARDSICGGGTDNCGVAGNCPMQNDLIEALKKLEELK